MTVTPSPYEVLGVDHSATQPEIRAAYQAALRSRAHSRQQITQAFNRLRSPVNRLAVDLVEPPWSGADAVDEVADLPTRFSLSDDTVAPLPRLSDLVADGLDEAVTPSPVIPVTTERFEHEQLEKPTAAMLPPIEIEL